jgi:hypothetical protein
MEQTPVLPCALIRCANQLMVMGPCNRDLTLSHIPLIRSIRRSSYEKLHTVVVHAATAPDTLAFTESGVVPLHRADAVEDLLPLHHQVPLRRLQRCRAYRTSPPMGRTNHKTISTLFITFRLTRCHPIQSLSTLRSKFANIYFIGIGRLNYVSKKIFL